MNAFTPGPWTDGFAIQSKSTGQPICRIISTAEWQDRTDRIKYGCGGFSQTTDEETAKANARLITATPEQHQALIDLEAIASLIYARAQAGATVRPDDWLELNHQIKQARAALTKAKGETA